MQLRIYWVAILLSLCPIFLFSQNSTDSTATVVWKVTGYADAYISIDQNLQNGQIISDFQFNHNRINRLKLNQGLLGLEYQANNVRANLAFHTGTYVKDNYAAEPELAQSINKAFVGFRLNKKRIAGWMQEFLHPISALKVSMPLKMQLYSVAIG